MSEPTMYRCAGCAFEGNTKEALAAHMQGAEHVARSMRWFEALRLFVLEETRR